MEKSSSSNTGLILAGAGIAGLAALTAWRRASRRFEFRDKVVLITGGSRGLGLVLAREFASQRAKLAICARDLDELERAADDLKTFGADVFYAACDMRHQPEVERLVSQVRMHFGRIDGLVNNAGVIQVGPLADQTQEDFEEAMRVHYWGPFYAMQSVLPEMRGRKEGRIINISSIGGKIPVPHLTPYCASKFALAGLSAAMRTELAKDNVYVTTVYPGLMRTGSHINAIFKGQNQLEFALFSVMNGLPLTSVSAENAARQIVSAARRGDAELIISIQAKMAAKMYALFPEFTSAILELTNRFLPDEGGIGKSHATGLESTSSASPSLLTKLIDAASHRNNELEPGEAIH
ncbi:MAG TPA: SDR family NAD(P)-dependent oxidoreductase [Pyrinomonadaceae bacterium]|nr:SDR family NAD(P)-dependent oxidoreductase [Pyrinomonadaceae bacterium]